MNVFSVNVGSTSLKYKVIAMPDEQVIAQGRVERIGSPEADLTHTYGDESPIKEKLTDDTTYMGAIKRISELLFEGPNSIPQDSVKGIGFKTVHGGPVTGSVLIDEEVIGAMEEYAFVAPAHNPPYIRAIRAFQKLFPNTPMVAVFETGFHRTMPQFAKTYAIPYKWYEKYGIRRYGFHGSSHRYIASRVPQFLNCQATGLRVISCHLGGSSSLCAIKDGISLDTSMGFSAQAGLPQGVRNGDLDVFALLYIMKKESLSIEEAQGILGSQGGLKGISGISADMRDLREAAASGNSRAKLAIDVLVHEAKKYIGAYSAVLGGLDVLVFTGGIGENSPETRTEICSNMEFLGITLDPDRNLIRAKEAIISEENGPVKVLVLPTNEEIILARETWALITTK